MGQEQELRVTVQGLRPGQKNSGWVIRPGRILYFFVEAAGPFIQAAAEATFPFDEGQVFFKKTDGLIYRASKFRGLDAVECHVGKRDFLRIRRSILVNINYVEQLSLLGSVRDVGLRHKQGVDTLFVSRRQFKALRRKLGLNGEAADTK